MLLQVLILALCAYQTSAKYAAGCCCPPEDEADKCDLSKCKGKDCGVAYTCSAEKMWPDGSNSGTCTATGKDETIFGDTTAYAYCSKRGTTATASTVPTYKYLKANSGWLLQIPGYWAKAKCTSYTVDTFMVQESAYKTAFDMCKKEGYEFVQPSQFATSPHWYPFQVGYTIKGWYQRDEGWIYSSWEKVAESTLHTC